MSPASATGPAPGDVLRIERDAGVAWITIDCPPLNLLGGELLMGLHDAVERLRTDPDTRVAVLRSADPDFFIAHGDVELIARVPEAPETPTLDLPLTHRVLEGLRRLPQVTIAQIEGLARGGGSEVALACDMRFAARGRAVLGQPEIALGILPGAGGTARLTRLLGRARASEVILGGDDFTAEEAERYGWINRALEPDALGPFVERLAHRIASFPATALREAKRTIQGFSDRAIEDDLHAEQRAFDRLMNDPGSERTPRMRRFVERGLQTREGERDLARACESLGEERADQSSRATPKPST